MSPAVPNKEALAVLLVDSVPLFPRLSEAQWDQGAERFGSDQPCYSCATLSGEGDTPLGGGGGHLLPPSPHSFRARTSTNFSEQLQTQDNSSDRVVELSPHPQPPGSHTVTLQYSNNFYGNYPQGCAIWQHGLKLCCATVFMPLRL